MDEATRACRLCGADIRDRHGNAKMCAGCAKAEQQRFWRERESHRGRAPRRRSEPRSHVATPCAVCGDTIVTSAGRETCSTRCYQWQRAHPGVAPDKVRNCRGCGQQFEVDRQSRKYCAASCSNRSGKARRVRGQYIVGPRAEPRPATIASVCTVCGDEFKSPNVNALYCTPACQRIVHLERRAADRAAKRAAREASRPLRMCEHCGSGFKQTRSDQRFCRPQCTVLHNQVIRRARRLDLPAESFSRQAVFDRDNWTCHLCGGHIDRVYKGKHPWAPSIDHVIPLAIAGSPGHVWVNVAASHLRCNLQKNARWQAA